MRTDVLLRVRYAECDPQNVVFNARYADYVDVASTEYLRKLCGGYDQLESAGFATQVVSLTIDWHSSARFDDVLMLAIECEHVGTSSFTLTCSIMQYSAQIPVATARVVYVFMEASLSAKCAIPDHVRSELLSSKAYGPINLAGVADK
ncbi:acyl-CoA thioesterase [Alteromonas flava]|uniref:acyl-CoA thioesterase n=1 Tax=Alteromonas flava TaxID=2048003 RepID=UPI000C282FE0|nr:thioesterase family protein [Alteromonas flava]